MSETNEVLGIVGLMLDVSEHKRVLKKLEEKNTILNNMSITDSLTKLYNRRYFEQVLKEKVSLLDRHKQIFACMLIDIDYFKNYNDSFGHQIGDVALKNISNIFQKSLLRPTDYAFRIGGEEFCILYNVDNIDNSIEFAQRLIAKIEAMKIRSGCTQVSPFVTISAGLVILKDIKYDESYAKKIYYEVDKLLYISKKNGRNQLNYKLL
jgi:diguanylate cyclase (GGDEF)-like protein